jgi:pimeloyl-ACP methyl ester carboxylesterase
VLHWLIFLAVLLSAGALLAAFTVCMMARMLLRPRRMNDARALRLLGRLSPEDVGLPRYEQFPFRVRDLRTGGTIQLAAWWIGVEGQAAAAWRQRCVVLVHGYGDAKIGALAWAPLFHSLGWNILAIDLRAHGESGGTISTAGFYERHDLEQALNELRAARPDETRTLVLFGVSLGAAVALATAELRQREHAPHPPEGTSLAPDSSEHEKRPGEIAGLILESPFADFKRAATAHGEILGYPGGILRDLALRLAERMSGVDFCAVSPERLLPHIEAPVLLIQSGDDPFVPPEDARRLREALAQRPADRITRDWHVEQCPHVFALAVCPDEYRRQIAAFLDEITQPRAREDHRGAAENAEVKR